MSESSTAAPPLLKRKQFINILVAVLILLQLPLWVGTGSVESLLYTYYSQYKVIQDNQALRLANQELIDKIAALKNGNSEVEARARLELGLVGQGETYYQVVK
jgi:cell division protein FtsB